MDRHKASCDSESFGDHYQMEASAATVGPSSGDRYIWDQALLQVSIDTSSRSNKCKKNTESHKCNPCSCESHEQRAPLNGLQSVSRIRQRRLIENPVCMWYIERGLDSVLIQPPPSWRNASLVAMKSTNLVDKVATWDAYTVHTGWLYSFECLLLIIFFIRCKFHFWTFLFVFSFVLNRGRFIIFTIIFRF